MTTFVSKGGARPRSTHMSSTRIAERGRSFLLPPGPRLEQAPVRFERHSPKVVQGVVNARNWTPEVRRAD